MRDRSRSAMKSASNMLQRALAWVPENRYKAVLLVLVLVIAAFGLMRLGASGLSVQVVEAERSYLETPIEPIDKNIGEVLVCENETKAMYVDTKTTNIRI
ncbi:MAG: hypothetical protein GX476_05630, partial [Firmicutes bacterium]|nr:hypothetical protein [Bacillota bacterium]